METMEVRMSKIVRWNMNGNSDEEHGKRNEGAGRGHGGHYQNEA
jgi:hypothetical protein